MFLQILESATSTPSSTGEKTFRSLWSPRSGQVSVSKLEGLVNREGAPQALSPKTGQEVGEGVSELLSFL